MISNSAAPVETSEMALSFLRMGTALVVISTTLVADDFGGPQ